MSNTNFALALLGLAFVLQYLSVAGEFVALRQIQTREFRYVDGVRLMRALRFPASIACLALIGLEIAHSPLFGSVGVLVGFLLALVTQGKELAYGNATKFWYAGVVPWMLILLTFANAGELSRLTGLGTLELPAQAVALSVILAAGFWLGMQKRAEQDLERLNA